jgi:hypothetical protein
MKMGDKLVIVGDGEFAGIAYEYFTHDSPYQVVAFAVEREFLKADEFMGVPVIPFEDLEQRLSPHDHRAFVLRNYSRMAIRSDQPIRHTKS